MRRDSRPPLRCSPSVISSAFGSGTSSSDYRHVEGAGKVEVSCPRLGSVNGEPHEISAGADTQLLVGVVQVELDGSPAQEQLSGHVSVGVPAADQGGDLLLLRGQLQ